MVVSAANVDSLMAPEIVVSPMMVDNTVVNRTLIVLVNPVDSVALSPEADVVIGSMTGVPDSVVSPKPLRVVSTGSVALSRSDVVDSEIDCVVSPKIPTVVSRGSVALNSSADVDSEIPA